MPNNDLINYMRSASRQMEEDYQQIQKRATEDPGTAGDQGEENWAKLLRNWLPHTFHIVTKGRILSERGIASPQIDVLVLQPEYPPYLLTNKLYLASGVLAAFECKLTLKTIHLAEFITNSIAIKSNVSRSGLTTPYRELQSPVLFGLLAHSHSWKRKNSSPIELIQNKLDNEDLNKISHPRFMPDILCVADLACWSASKLLMRQLSLPESQRITFSTLFDSENAVRTCYSCSSAKFENIKGGSSPIGSMITLLSYKLAFQNTALRPLAQYYMVAGIKAIGAGNIGRSWSKVVFSEVLMKKKVEGESTHDFWDECSVMFH